MLNKIAKLIFFFLAYLPLFIILVLKNVQDMKIIIISSVTMIIVGFVSVTILLKTINSLSPSLRKVKIKEQRNSDYLNFFLTYLLPLFIGLSNIRDALIFALLFFIVVYFYLDTSLFAINPLLRIFFHLNIFKVEFQDKNYYLLSKFKYSEGEYNLKLKSLDSDVLMEDYNG